MISDFTGKTGREWQEIRQASKQEPGDKEFHIPSSAFTYWPTVTRQIFILEQYCNGSMKNVYQKLKTGSMKMR